MLSPTRVVAAATILYAALFTVLGLDRYLTFHSGADLGLFVQTIASAGHGFSNTFEGTDHFAYHFSPILYLCAPFVWVAHSAVALIVIQAVATALVAPALYAIARKRTSDAGAAALACVALLYPPLQGVTFTDFHEVAFAPAAVAWLLWAIDARRFGIAAVLLAVVLSIKEDQAPAMLFLGIVGAIYFTRRGERGAAAFCSATALAAIVVFGSYFAIVRPLAGAASTWMPSHFYAWSASAGEAPLGTQIVARVSYALEAFVPLAFVPFRSRLLVLALPGFAEVLASHEPLTYTMGQHYAAVWVPYVLVAFCVGGANLLEHGRSGRRWIWASGVLCALMLAAFNPLHLAHFLRAPDASDRATGELISRIPPDASVGTYDEIYSHLGLDPRAQVGFRNDPAFVIEDSAYRSARWNGVLLPQFQAALARGEYVLVAQNNGVMLYRRR